LEDANVDPNGMDTEDDNNSEQFDEEEDEEEDDFTNHLDELE